MISNPATFFTSGGTQKSFTYEGGSTLYHFSPNDNNLSTSMENNVIFFANDESHGLEVLLNMLQFAIDCKAEYIAKKSGSEDIHSEEFLERAKEEMKRFQMYIEAINQGKVKLTLAPTNQFYMVAWACNDTLH